MPTGNPQVGETWTTRDPASNRVVQGIIAEVVPNVITLVSFTGNRIRFPPERFNWTYAAPAPLTSQRCQATGCTSSAVFVIPRQFGPGRTYVCPRHTITGVASTLISDDFSPGQPDAYVVPPCPLCTQNRLVEQGTPANFRGTLFLCEGCHGRMVYVTGEQRHQPILEALQSCREASLDVVQILVSPTFMALADDPGPAPLPTHIYSVPVLPDALVAPRAAFLTFARNVRAAAFPVYQPPPLAKTCWVEKSTGSIVVVERALGDAVHFRPQDGGSNLVMTLRDFHQYHRELEVRAPKPKANLPTVAPGDEWIGPGDQMVKIIEVNASLGSAIADFPDGVRQSIRLADMARWQKLVRVSTYDRLLRQTDDFE